MLFYFSSRWRASGTDSFGNDVFQITMKRGAYDADAEPLALFGEQYHFKLEGVVDCPEYLVNHDLLLAMAGRYKMNLVSKKRFREVFDQYKCTDEGKRLLGKMTALEVGFCKRYFIVTVNILINICLNFLADVSSRTQRRGFVS